jgi:uncharacterized damage-inducible protein DinB
MTIVLPEPWLRGPLPGVPSLLQPAAHAFVMASEDVTTAIADLTSEQLWREPGGIASAGFHLGHLAGRARLPSTVLGLLFHAAEHASRHTGQIVTTSKLVRGLP